MFQLAFVPGVTAEQILSEARGWARQWADPCPPLPPAPIGADAERRLRVGYVSPDFRDHCQALYMTPLLASHDRSQVETICYASVAQPDAHTERLKALADGWRDVGALDDAALAARIREDGVDILVDLTMHMAGNRLPLFARRAAPVQIAWLAYPGTTGLSQIDYRITDRHIDPPPAELSHAGSPLLVDDPRYSERSLVLPDSFWCYDPLSLDLAPGPLPALERGYVTFGCLGNLAKVNPHVIALWAQVLAAAGRAAPGLAGEDGALGLDGRAALRAHPGAGLPPGVAAAVQRADLQVTASQSCSQ